MPSEEMVTAEDEDPQKLAASRKKFWTNLVIIGVMLLLIILSVLCNLVDIPGLPDYLKHSARQFAALEIFVGANFIGMNLEEFGLASPQTEEPKPMTGFELC